MTGGRRGNQPQENRKHRQAAQYVTCPRINKEIGECLRTAVGQRRGEVKFQVRRLFGPERAHCSWPSPNSSWAHISSAFSYSRLNAECKFSYARGQLVFREG